jgi:5-methylcytosine-specific restriction endonuclease McrA
MKQNSIALNNFFNAVQQQNKKKKFKVTGKQTEREAGRAIAICLSRTHPCEQDASCEIQNEAN